MSTPDVSDFAPVEEQTLVLVRRIYGTGTAGSGWFGEVGYVVGQQTTPWTERTNI